VREPERWPPVGDPARARTVLGWEPRTSFAQLVAELVEADLARLGVAPGRPAPGGAVPTPDRPAPGPPPPAVA
jgi:hypothetical protein